jgi:Protein of unknown function (DUF962)
MTPAELTRWQWTDYRSFHQSRANLLLHIVAVPLFLIANISLVLALLQGYWTKALVALVVMLLAFAVQAVGHGKESNPSIPFASPANAFGRIFVEQWINFPRYVLSGGWWRALRA